MSIGDPFEVARFIRRGRKGVTFIARDGNGWIARDQCICFNVFYLIIIQMVLLAAVM